MSSPSSQFVNTIVKAGAGAGKTHDLIHKIVDLVKEYSDKNNGALPSFVVTTFTRKATQEVRERLMIKALEIRKDDPVFGNLFLKFLRGSGNLMVSTIHGVLNHFLRQQGIKIGLDPSFTISKSSEIQLNTLIHELFIAEPKLVLLVKTFGWRKVKSFLLDFHKCKIANPNIKKLPEEFLSAYYLNQLNHLDDYCSELIPFLEQLNKNSKSSSLKNYTSIIERVDVILKSNQEFLKKINDIKTNLDSLPRSLGSLTQWDERAKSLRKEIGHILSEIKEDPWWDSKQVKTVYENKTLLEEIGLIFSNKLIQHKISLAEIDMEDLELFTLLLLREFPESGHLFSKQWHYWFIDEYQDTSPIQVEILKSLIGVTPHYVVGDPQQSIYYFRGSRSKVFQDKIAAISDSEGIVKVKTINRRSLPPTLHLINDLMKTINHQQFNSMEALPSNEIDDKLVGFFYSVPEDEAIHYLTLKRSIEKLLNSGIQPSEIALLCRENKELINLSGYLRSVGLPVQISTQGRFLECPSVKEALALWRFLVNPYDDKNLVQLLRAPLFRISDSKLFYIAQTNPLNFWTGVRTLNEEPSIQKLTKGLFDLINLGQVETWQKLLFESSVFNQITEDDFSGRNEGNLWKLISIINEQSKLGKLNFVDPLNLNLETDSSQESEAKPIRESNQVQIMTIHASKGLEFDHIFLPFLNHSPKTEIADFFTSDIDLNNWSIGLQDSISKENFNNFFVKNVIEESKRQLNEESERLLYVAVTRAKKTLHFFLPNDIENKTEKGWTRHFIKFTENGFGQFKHESNLYEFENIDSEKMKDLPYQSTQVIEDRKFKYSQLTHESKVKSRSLTHSDFNDKTNYFESENQNQEIQVNPISYGIKIHKYLESYVVSKGMQTLPPNIMNFLLNATFPLIEIIKNGNAEWPFRILENNTILEGQIDLCGIDSENRFWIVDYKTGTSLNNENAFKQLEFYARCLQTLGTISNLNMVHLAVCSITENKSFIKKIQYEN